MSDEVPLADVASPSRSRGSRALTLGILQLVGVVLVFVLLVAAAVTTFILVLVYLWPITFAVFALLIAAHIALAIPTFVSGIRAIRADEGRGRAVAGIVLSSIATLIYLGAIVGVIGLLGYWTVPLD